MFSRVCPACGDFVAGRCPCGGQRADGRIVTARRLRLEAVWSDPRWKAISRRVCSAARAGGGCVDCGTKRDLVGDHVEGFDGPDDPRAFDETLVVARCRSCSGQKDGARRLRG